MENKLELRVGDVVRLKPMTVFETFLDGAFQIEGCDGFLKTDMVESIMSRAKTPQETIARLEAELAKAPRRIEWSGGECPLGENEKVIVWLRGGETISGLLSDMRWDCRNTKTDIIAYMVLPS